MKSGFKAPIAVKEGRKIKSPWNFDCPPYDERSSCYVNAGTHYGVGYKVPVGHEGNPKNIVDILPRDRKNVNTLKSDEIPRKNLPIELRE